MIRTLLIALFATSSICSSATWTVEDDFTGDFATVQQAVNASADGDTILIGAGYFYHRFEVVTPGWTRYVCVTLNKDNLTIIGAGPDSTFIGRGRPWEPSEGETMGFAASSYWGSEHVTVKNLRIQNTRAGFIADDCSSVTIDNCHFEGHHDDLLVWNGELKMTSTVFKNQTSDGSHCHLSNVVPALISDCRFEEDSLPSYHATQIIVGWGSMATIDQCRFSGCAVGVNLQTGSNAVLNDCMIENQLRWGCDISGYGGTSATLSNCRIAGTDVGVLMDNWRPELIMDRCTFEDIGTASIKSGTPRGGHVRNCNLAKGSRYVVIGPAVAKNDSASAIHFDMRNNWWGTTDPDSIRAWIVDAEEDRLNNPTIDWDPFLDGLVTNRETGFGDLKRLFR
jgi:Right handed beta helix region